MMIELFVNKLAPAPGFLDQVSTRLVDVMPALGFGRVAVVGVAAQNGDHAPCVIRERVGTSACRVRS